MPSQDNDNGQVKPQKKQKSKIINIWCCACGEQTIYQPNIQWAIKNDDRGLGICTSCSDILDETEMVLPEGDGYANF